MKAVMPNASPGAKNLRVEALSIIPDTDPELPVVVANLHLDLARLRVLECISQRLACKPVDFIAQYRIQTPRGAFHPHPKDGCITAGFVDREFFAKGPYGHGKISGVDRGRAQPLCRIAPLGDCFSSLVDRAIERLLGLAVRK